jgi:hypothetical protein
MEHKDFRILGLTGSLRRASFHRGIVGAAHEVAPEWMSCESFDLAQIPYFNQDVEDHGKPDPEMRLLAARELGLGRRSAWRLRTPLRESRRCWRPGRKSSP